ncbi:MAG: methyltransferase domain-containing protein [Gaiella sp.]
MHGHVLEICGDEYAVKFGRNISKIDILDILPDNPRATIIGDIADAPALPDATFECVLVTQTLPFVFDLPGVFATLHRILAPGGVALITTPGICRIAPVEDRLFGHWWNLTPASLARLAGTAFGTDQVSVETFGNVLSATGFLFGLGPYDLSPSELDDHDPAFPVTVGLRAVKQV